MSTPRRYIAPSGAQRLQLVVGHCDGDSAGALVEDHEGRAGRHDVVPDDLDRPADRGGSTTIGGRRRHPVEQGVADAGRRARARRASPLPSSRRPPVWANVVARHRTGRPPSGRPTDGRSLPGRELQTADTDGARQSGADADEGANVWVGPRGQHVVQARQDAEGWARNGPLEVTGSTTNAGMSTRDRTRSTDDRAAHDSQPVSTCRAPGVPHLVAADRDVAVPVEEHLVDRHLGTGVPVVAEQVVGDQQRAAALRPRRHPDRTPRGQVDRTAAPGGDVRQMAGVTRTAPPRRSHPAWHPRRCCRRSESARASGGGRQPRSAPTGARRHRAR